MVEVRKEKLVDKTLCIDEMKKQDIFYLVDEKNITQKLVDGVEPSPMMRVCMEGWSDNLTINDSHGVSFTYDLSAAAKILKKNKIVLAISLNNGIIHLCRIDSPVRKIRGYLAIDDD